jgi:hypothetical protein
MSSSSSFTTSSTAGDSTASQAVTECEFLDAVERSESPVSPITTRWEPLLVTRIENVRVTNMARFDESKQVNVGSPLSARVTRDQLGMLCQADLEIIVTFSESAPHEHLSMNLENSVTLASRETLVTVGRSVYHEGTAASSDHCRNTFRIVVPLTRGLYDRVPILDEIHTKGKHYVHHTINIAGLENGRSCQWRIRVRVDPESAVVDVVSVGNSLVDMVRIGESWNNLKDMVVLGANKITDSAKACWASRKASKHSYAALPTSEPRDAGEQCSSFAAMPNPIPVHASMYPSVPQQHGQPVPQSGMMFVPAFQPKTAPNADGMPQPQVIYYAMPSNPVWPPVAAKQDKPASDSSEAPKFELVSEDE